MHEFLYKCGLSETKDCACGTDCENWRHVLIKCPLYEDLRNLREWGMLVQDESVDVSCVSMQGQVRKNE